MTVVRTEMDYNQKTSKATVYYYLDEQHAIDSPQETVFAEVIEVPYVEQVELEKSGVTAKVKAEEAMTAKLEEHIEVAPVEEVIPGVIK